MSELRTWLAGLFQHQDTTTLSRFDYRGHSVAFEERRIVGWRALGADAPGRRVTLIDGADVSAEVAATEDLETWRMAAELFLDRRIAIL